MDGQIQAPNDEEGLSEGNADTDDARQLSSPLSAPKARVVKSILTSALGI